MTSKQLQEIADSYRRLGGIEALEKIKAEFEEDRYILLNQTVAIKIMDNYISELKGENKNEK